MLSSTFQPHWDLYPRTYEAPYTINPPKSIDGNIFKEEWKDIPWSLDFDDIRGPEDAPPDDRPSLACRTRMKMMWDEQYVYIAALLESDEEIRATFRERNSPIFQQDSDFEVFIDAMSCCHDYKELELNALNTVWNLMLNKPYWDGGSEHSGRIAKPGDHNYYDVKDQKTAVQIVEGQINVLCDDNNDKKCRNIWSVEMALSHQDSLRHQPGNYGKPKVGDLWRINFSRVERKGLINWTWQPQRIWDPELHRHVGKVDMHLPDAWGYLLFGSSQRTVNRNSRQYQRDPYWPSKITVMNIYYAQKRYKELHNHYALSLKDMDDLLDKNLIQPFEVSRDYRIEIKASSHSYTAKIYHLNSSDIVSITHDRLMTVTSANMKSIKS